MWTWRYLANTSMRPPAIVVSDEFISCSLQLENNQLLAKAEVLGNQACPGFENGGESVGKAPNHRKVP